MRTDAGVSADELDAQMRQSWSDTDRVSAGQSAIRELRAAERENNRLRARVSECAGALAISVTLADPASSEHACLALALKILERP
jgi:hypothetical protein